VQRLQQRIIMLEYPGLCLCCRVEPRTHATPLNSAVRTSTISNFQSISAFRI